MTSIWPPESLDEAMIIAQRVRICELETALRQIHGRYSTTEVIVRQVLMGCGASMQEILTASVPMAALRKSINDALERVPPPRPTPTPEQIEAGRLGTPVLVK